jgi:hypothetical protein
LHEVEKKTLSERCYVFSEVSENKYIDDFPCFWDVLIGLHHCGKATAVVINCFEIIKQN